MSGTGAGVIMLLVGIAMLGGGVVVVIFAGKALGAAQDPDITISSSETGQSARMGKSGLLFFIVLGLLLAAAGIGLVVGGIKALAAPADTATASSAATASPTASTASTAAPAAHKPSDSAKRKGRHAK